MARKDRMEQYKQAPKKEVEVVGDTIGESITESFKEKQKKPLMKDTHMRTSFLFKRELRDRLDVLSEYYGRGYRTHFINNALQNAIISAEEQMRQDASK